MAFYGLFNSGKIFEARVSEGEIVEDNFAMAVHLYSQAVRGLTTNSNLKC